MWQSTTQLLESHSHLHPREAVTDAMMAAPAERQMFVGVLAANLEILTVGEFRVIGITRTEREQQPRSGGKINVADPSPIFAASKPKRRNAEVLHLSGDKSNDQTEVLA
jgi:hypothetical protein